MRWVYHCLHSEISSLVVVIKSVRWNIARLETQFLFVLAMLRQRYWTVMALKLWNVSKDISIYLIWPRPRYFLLYHFLVHPVICSILSFYHSIQLILQLLIMKPITHYWDNWSNNQLNNQARQSAVNNVLYQLFYPFIQSLHLTN